MGKINHLINLHSHLLTSWSCSADLQPRRWQSYVPPKHWFICKLRSTIPQKGQDWKFKKKKISGQKSHIWARHQDILTDWPSVAKWLWLWLYPRSWQFYYSNFFFNFRNAVRTNCTFSIGAALCKIRTYLKRRCLKALFEAPCIVPLLMPAVQTMQDLLIRLFM
jgi:hypothetical protein